MQECGCYCIGVFVVFEEVVEVVVKLIVWYVFVGFYVCGYRFDMGYNVFVYIGYFMVCKDCMQIEVGFFEIKEEVFIKEVDVVQNFVVDYKGCVGELIYMVGCVGNRQCNDFVV